MPPRRRDKQRNIKERRRRKKKGDRPSFALSLAVVALPLPTYPQPPRWIGSLSRDNALTYVRIVGLENGP